MDLEKLMNRPVDLVENGALLPFAERTANKDKKIIYERRSAWFLPPCGTLEQKTFQASNP